MGFSLGGGKNKSKSTSTTDQTQTNTLSNRAVGMLGRGIGETGALSYQRFDPASIGQYESPYTQEVIDASLAQMAQGDAQAFTRLKSDLAGSGGFGNERRGILEAELAGQQSRDRAALIASMRDKGFTDAREIARGENQNENQTNLLIQQLLNDLYGRFAVEGTQRLQGTTTGKQSGSNIGFGFTYGGG